MGFAADVNVVLVLAAESSRKQWAVPSDANSDTLSPLRVSLATLISIVSLCNQNDAS